MVLDDENDYNLIIKHQLGRILRREFQPASSELDLRDFGVLSVAIINKAIITTVLVTTVQSEVD